jgi:HEAT repeat protein
LKVEGGTGSTFALQPSTLNCFSKPDTTNYMVWAVARVLLALLVLGMTPVAHAGPDDRDVHGLVATIRAGSAGERNRAVERLRHLQSPVARRLLAEMLADRSPDARGNAAWALGIVGDRGTVRPLMGALDDPVPPVRLAAAQALGELRSPLGAYSLGRALDDPERYVRLAAVRALARIADVRATPPLVKALRAADVEVRLTAATALTGRADRRVRAALRDRLKADSSSAVRFVIARGLAEQGERAGVTYLCRALGTDLDRAVRRQAATVLGGARGTDSREALRRALTDEDPEVQALARAALERRKELPKPRAARPAPASAPRTPTTKP